MAPKIAMDADGDIPPCSVLSSRDAALKWDKWKQEKYNGQQTAEPTAQRFAKYHSQESKGFKQKDSEVMSDANTIIMLESRNQELQIEVNRLVAENKRLVEEQGRKGSCGEAVLNAIRVPCQMFVQPFVCLWGQIRG